MLLNNLIWFALTGLIEHLIIILLLYLLVFHKLVLIVGVNWDVNLTQNLLVFASCRLGNLVFDFQIWCWNASCVHARSWQNLSMLWVAVASSLGRLVSSCRQILSLNRRLLNLLLLLLIYKTNLSWEVLIILIKLLIGSDDVFQVIMLIGALKFLFVFVQT